MQKPVWNRPPTLYLMLICCIAAGLATLIPYTGASIPSILGYRSICPFAPISTTLILYTGLLIYGQIRRQGA